MTGTEFLAYVKRSFKRSDKDTELYEAMTDTVMDMRLRFYPEDYKVEAYIAGLTSAGDYRIALPSDFGHLIGEVTLVDNAGVSVKTLVKMTKENYDRIYGNRLYTDTSNITTGVPEHFCIFAKQLLIAPLPDKYTYRYYINYTKESAVDVTSATTNVPFTDRYREVVKHGVLMRIKNDLELYEDASAHERLFETGLIKISANDEVDAGAVSSIVGSSI